MQFIDTVHVQHTEIIITKHGKPWAKLMAVDDTPSVQPFLGALSGVGVTIGNLLEPFEDEWECDRDYTHVNTVWDSPDSRLNTYM